MKNFRDALREEMKNPEFKKEWDALEPEFRQIRESLDRKNISLTNTNINLSASQRYEIFSVAPQCDSVFNRLRKNSDDGNYSVTNANILLSTSQCYEDFSVAPQLYG